MTASVLGVGIDVVEVERFRHLSADKTDRFLTNNFTQGELEYCFSYKDAAPHLAGTFAAKEAAFKALGLPIAQSAIEIRREDKAPTVWIDNRRAEVLVSISHTAALATAIAIRQ